MALKFRSLCIAAAAAAFVVAGVCSPAVADATAQRVTPTNPCALYAQLRKDASPDVVKVQILGVQNGVAGVMILGLARRVNVSLNGVDMRLNKVHSQQIVCGREAIGELSAYDLSATGMDAGYFQVQADTIVEGQSLVIRQY